MSVAQAIQPLLALPEKERWRAMKSIKWVLVSPAGQYGALTPAGRCELTTDRDRAQVFDGRDNEIIKAKFWSVMLRVEMQPEIVTCAS